MKFVFEQRASGILYNLITSFDTDKKFLIPANVCPIVVATFLKAAHPFEFVDISMKTLCIDEDQCLSLISKRPDEYAGVLFVRTYGVMDSFDSFFETLKKVKCEIFIIDDRCLAIPSFEDNLGFADVNLYSTGYSKYVDTGSGAFARMKDHIPYGRKELPFDIEHLDNLNASFKKAINQIDTVPTDRISSNWLNVSNREENFIEYRLIVEKEVGISQQMKEMFNKKYSAELPEECLNFQNKFQNWRFNITVKNKKALLKKIFDAGLFASDHFCPTSQIFYNQKLTNVDNLYFETVNLFTDRYFPFEKTDKMISCIQNYLKKIHNT